MEPAALNRAWTLHRASKCKKCKIQPVAKIWKLQVFLDELWGHLLEVQDACRLVSTARLVKASADALLPAIAFAASRPSCTVWQLGASPASCPTSLSLKDWSRLAKLIVATSQEMNWKITDAFTFQAARVTWSCKHNRGGEIQNIELIPVTNISRFAMDLIDIQLRAGSIRCPLGLASSSDVRCPIIDLDLPEGAASEDGFDGACLESAPSDSDLCKRGVVLALKATFVYLEPYDDVPEFALHTIIRLGSSKFAFISMRPYANILLSRSLPRLAEEICKRLGQDWFDMDDFFQLPSVRRMPTTWFARGDRLHYQLRQVRACCGQPVLRDGCSYVEFGNMYGFRKASSEWVNASACLVVCRGVQALRTILRNDVPRRARESGATVSQNFIVSTDVVIDNIVHSEPAAVVDENEAALVSNEQWAGMVQQLAQISIATESVALDSDLDSLDKSSTVGGTSNTDAAVQSAPAATDSRQCLLLSTYVWTSIYECKLAQELIVGQCVLSSHGHAEISAVRVLPVRERDIIRIHAKSSEETMAHEGVIVAMTTSHTLPVWRDSIRRTRHVRAMDIRAGDHLRSMTATLIVQHVERCTRSASVVEISLVDKSSTMFISGEISRSTLIEVCGATAPKIENHQVKILFFNRFDGFREALLENEELESCRQELEANGFHADLSKHGLGPAKMFVRPEIAMSVLHAIEKRNCDSSKHALKCTEVVTSNEFEEVVKFVVRRTGKRSIFVQHEEVLPLPDKSHRQFKVKNTFLEAASSSSDASISIRTWPE